MKRHLSKLFFLMFLMFDVINTINQAQNPQLGAAMPSIIPLSPEVASISKFSGYQVNYYNGIPDISIPLFDIKSKNLTMPMILRYHSSGIKVTDVSSWVGLGWTLDVGGVINRKVIGKPDEQVSSVIVNDADTLDLSNENEYLYYIKDSFQKIYIDTEPDQFYYSIPGGSGSFQFINGSTLFMPLVPFVVEKGISGNSLETIKLIDSEGNSYYFDYSLSPQTYYPSKSGSDPNSSWLLTKLVDANKTDSILFTYQSAGYGTLFADNIDYYVVEDLPGNTNPNCNIQNFSSSIYPYNEEISTSGYDIVNSEIGFLGGKATFILSSDSRLDRIHNFKKLDTLKIYADPDTLHPIKYIVFYTTYFINGTNKRLRLDSLGIADKNKTIIQCYRFEYNTNVSLPGYTSREKDWWGYYNGRNNSTLIPRQQVPYNYSLEWIGSDLTNGRDPDTTNMQAYILKSITYPTGGKSTFEFETNRYYEYSNLKYAGGLRIRKIITDDNNGGTITKTFKYEDSRFNTFLDSRFFKTTTTVIHTVSDGDGCSCLLSKRSTIYTSNPSIDINPYDGSPVVYPIVTEYSGDEVNNSGKIIYEFSDNMDSQVILSNHFNECYAPSIMTERTHDDKLKLISKSFERGLLEAETIYKNDNGQYKEVKRTENLYGAFLSKTIYNAGFISWRSDTYGGAGNPSWWRSEYEFDNYYAYTSDNRLKYNAEFIYDQNDNTKYIKQETYYSYNDTINLQINKIKKIDSKGDSLITVIKYPTDFTTGVYPEMAGMNNIVSVPVEIQKLVNNIPINKTLAKYKKYYTRFFAPDSIDQQIGTNPWETRFKYLEYDTYGNVLSVSKDYDIIVNYLWGYNHSYPVAEIKNATYTEVNALSPNLSLLETGNSPEQQRIRSGLPGAIIIFYTYKQLIGMTSMTDPTGITTYYEYDDFGRLKHIKDHDGRILKTHEYHYK